MGYNLALGDAAILLDCLQHAHQRGLPAGHLSVTEAYQKRRQIENSCPNRHNPASGSCPFPAKWNSHHAGATGMAAFGKTALRHHIRDIAMGGKLSPAPLFPASSLPDARAKTALTRQPYSAAPSATRW